MRSAGHNQRRLLGSSVPVIRAVRPIRPSSLGILGRCALWRALPSGRVYVADGSQGSIHVYDDLTDPDAASRYFIAQGSYLRREGKVVLDSLSKVFLTATKQGRKLDVLLQGQPVIHARLRVGSEPAEVSLNGEIVKPLYDKAAQTILISERHE